MIIKTKASIKVHKALCALLLAVCFAAGTPVFAQSIPYTPWDVAAASKDLEPAEKKPYTIMIYMNGSDLESENGAATLDMLEILESGLDSRNANVLLLTGGARRWQNNVVPANRCVLWEAADGWLYELADVGLVNMGDAGTLSSFIQFSMQNFPADQYGLILWDHGGGSIMGYGRDEKFADSSLLLPDLRYAFEKAGLKNKRLSFLGFDSCLMATVEMAVVASDYADYLIASEDLEPGDGWDYHFLSVFNDNPQADGKTAGIAVTDYFMQFYGSDSEEILTLSVTDLSQVKPVMNAMGALMRLCTKSLRDNSAVSGKTMTGTPASFRTLSHKRYRTKTFGEGSPRDNECDMVDIGDMATKLADLYPAESEALLAALAHAVVYNRHNSDTPLRGLSTYYIYGGKSVGDFSLETYTALQMDKDYTQYLKQFYQLLRSDTGSRTRISRSLGTGGSSAAVFVPDEEVISLEVTLWQPVKGQEGYYRMVGMQRGIQTASGEQASVGVNARWPKIGGRPVCLTPINHSERNYLYAVPASLNGQDCDIIVCFNEKHPDGSIMGARNEEGLVLQKGLDPIKKGDKLAFYYQEKRFGSGNESAMRWHKDKEITVDSALSVSWEPLNGEHHFYSLRLTDIRKDVFFTALQPITSS